MKKYIILIVIIVLLAANGCSFNNSSTVNNSTLSNKANEKPIADIPSIKPNQVKLIFDSDDERKIKIENIGTRGFFGNYSFGYCPIRNSDGEAWEDFSVINDFENEKTYSLETPKELKKQTVSAGSGVIMKERYLYEWQNVSVNNEDINKFIRIDAKEKKIETLDSKKTYSPFIYFSKLNENEFITSLCGKAPGDATSISVVTKYNVETGQNKEIINELYTNNEGDLNSKGLLLESVTAIEEKIYGLGRKIVNGKYIFNLYIFNDDGKLEKTINVQAVEDALQNTTTIKIYKIGNYLLLENWNLEFYIYKIDNDDAILIVGKEENIFFPYFMENFYNSSKYKYIYYYHACTGDGEHRDNYLFGIELATGRTKQVNIDIDNEKKYLSQCYIDEKGNMIFEMLPDHLDCLNIRNYYITNKTLLKVFENAPYID